MVAPFWRKCGICWLDVGKNPPKGSRDFQGAGDAVNELERAMERENMERENPDAAIELRGVFRQDARGRRLLDGVTLTILRGAFTTLAGPSGAGKTTLLRLINRLDEADGGSISVLGRALDQWDVGALRQRVALVAQEPSLLGMTVRENLILPFRLRGGLPPQMQERMEAAMEEAELEPEILNQHSAVLSVGQKQRAALARALIGEPEVLLLDEPTAGQDPRTAERMMKRLHRLTLEKGLTVLMVSHRLEHLRQNGGRLAVLIGGRLHGEGDAADA